MRAHHGDAMEKLSHAGACSVVFFECFSGDGTSKVRTGGVWKGMRESDFTRKRLKL